MNHDQIFKTRIEKSSDFKFDASVVNVFDDMVVRSVPFYLEFQRMITEIARDYAKPGTSLFDLGCSTGTTMLSINTVLDDSVRFVGVDNSPQMLESCRKNFNEMGVTRPFEFLRLPARPFEELRVHYQLPARRDQAGVWVARKRDLKRWRKEYSPLYRVKPPEIVRRRVVKPKLPNKWSYIYSRR